MFQCATRSMTFFPEEESTTLQEALWCLESRRRVQQKVAPWMTEHVELLFFIRYGYTTVRARDFIGFSLSAKKARQRMRMKENDGVVCTRN